MSTRSTIALEHADGTVEQVYCHYDGYISHNGKILLEQYSDPFKLRDLIDCGDMATFGEPFAARGEELIVRRYKNVDEYFDECQQEEYDYILRTDGKWYVRSYHFNYDLMDANLLNGAE